MPQDRRTAGGKGHGITHIARERRLRALDSKARALLTDNPALQARTRALLNGELTMPRSPQPRQVLITMRVPHELVRRADALVPALAHDDDTAATVGTVSRSTVLRLALLTGLKTLERKYSGSPHYARL